MLGFQAQQGGIGFSRGGPLHLGPVPLPFCHSPHAPLLLLPLPFCQPPHAPMQLCIYLLIHNGQGSICGINEVVQADLRVPFALRVVQI